MPNHAAVQLQLSSYFHPIQRRAEPFLTSKQLFLLRHDLHEQLPNGNCLIPYQWLQVILHQSKNQTLFVQTHLELLLRLIHIHVI